MVSISRLVRLPVLTGLGAALVSASVPAQDAAATRPNMIVDMFSNAGLVGYVIIFLSIVGLTLIIEGLINIKREKLAPPELVDELEALFDEENFQEAIELCEAEKGFLTNACAAGLTKLGHSFDTINEAWKEMAEEETVKLHQKVGWLSLIAATSPMLGLLGTVGGMFDTFGVIAEKKGSVNPSDLAGGIKFALVTTIFGLIVAIPVSAFFFFFRNRAINASLEIGAILADLFERFREAERKAA
jgi:biopolymer transport protein ExbB